MKKKNYVCVGHSTYDITIPVDEYPIENVKYRLKNHIECGGGPASNGAYLLAKWGEKTTLVSIVGDDHYGHLVYDDFKKIGANTKYIELHRNHQTTSSYIIANKTNGSRTILSSKRPPIRQLNQDVTVNADVILLDGEHPETALKVLVDNDDEQVISVLDAGRLNKDTKLLGKLVTYLVCSRDFAEEFAGIKINYHDIKTIIACYEKLKKYFDTNVIITLESHGSFTEINGKYKQIPSIKVKALDSTGAGDIFHGAFTYFIGNEYPLEEAIRLASITAAISVTRIGSRFSIPELQEVLEYKEKEEKNKK